jgi:hypothetical protein
MDTLSIIALALGSLGGFEYHQSAFLDAGGGGGGNDDWDGGGGGDGC